MKETPKQSYYANVEQLNFLEETELHGMYRDITLIFFYTVLDFCENKERGSRVLVSQKTGFRAYGKFPVACATA
jgi:hypothetical protein